MRYFSADVFDGFDDGPKGFFAVYRELFEWLEEFEAEEEMIRTRGRAQPTPNRTVYTSFGSKNSPYEPSLRMFYEKWLHFSTARRFDEDDRYQPTREDNRRIRRAMEKENERSREQLRREYSETVRELAAWMRKRDPRYIAHQKQKAEEREQEECLRKERERQKRAEERNTYVEQDWSRVDHDRILREGLNNGDDISADVDQWDEEEEEEELFCAPCKKTFKSLRQWKNHEKSKKHRSILLSMGIDPDIFEEEEVSEDDVVVEEAVEPIKEDDPVNELMEKLKLAEKPQSPSTKGRSQDEKTRAGKQEARKPRRAKKISDPTTEEHRCNVCSCVFESRNKLFKHVHDEDHAIAEGKQSKSKSNSKR